MPFFSLSRVRERVGVRALLGRVIAIRPLTLALSHKGRGNLYLYAVGSFARIIVAAALKMPPGP